jgi:hypothetical protein
MHGRLCFQNPIIPCPFPTCQKLAPPRLQQRGIVGDIDNETHGRRSTKARKVERQKIATPGGPRTLDIQSLGIVFVGIQ